MAPIENARCDAGAVSLKFGGFEAQHNCTDPETQYQPRTDGRIRRLAGPRYEREIVHIHALGPRPLAELLAEIATATGKHDLVVGLVEEYAQLDRDVLRLLGGDNFPPMPLGPAR